MSEYLGIYNGSYQINDTIGEVHDELMNMHGNIDVEDIDFFELKPLTVSRSVIYHWDPLVGT